jgi:hypothetical protein
MPINPYQKGSSLRLWFQEVEANATALQIPLDACTLKVQKMLPAHIQKYLRTLAPHIKTQWSLLQSSLLNRFGGSTHAEDQSIERKLRSMVQGENEEIEIHAVNWEYQHTLLSSGFPQDVQGTLFYSVPPGSSIKVHSSRHETSRLTICH